MRRLCLRWAHMSEGTFCHAGMAQSDTLPTEDQVAGSIPTESGNILLWRLIIKYSLRSFSLFLRFKKGSCQFLAKECAQYWLIN